MPKAVLTILIFALIATRAHAQKNPKGKHTTRQITSATAPEPPDIFYLYRQCAEDLKIPLNRLVTPNEIDLIDACIAPYLPSRKN